MSISIKTSHNLRILGLSQGATSAEIRSAFRRLARTCHPDAVGVGKECSRRFEQIATAYAFLKGLPPEELGQGVPQAQTSAHTAKSGAKKRWTNPLSWRKDKQRKLEHEEKTRQETAQKAEEKKQREQDARIDSILDRTERVVSSRLLYREQQTKDYDTQELLTRLASDLPKVRHLALARLGAEANQCQLFDALVSMLHDKKIDDKTARLVAALPLKQENLRKLSNLLVDRVSSLPTFLLAHLLRLHTFEMAELDLLERYMQGANANGVAMILKHWPQEPFLSETTLQKLLSHQDEAVLLLLLGTMKQRNVTCSAQTVERLKSLAADHPNPALRVWSKALLAM